MSATFCKGCGMAIIPGQMRRGDDWHASCFNEIERRVLTDPRCRSPRGAPPRGLTRTQHIILEAATRSPSGSVVMGAGDRRGTRIVRFDDMDRPVVIAYANPEYFLLGRGLLAEANERYVYRITEAGRAMLNRKRRQPETP